MGKENAPEKAKSVKPLSGEDVRKLIEKYGQYGLREGEGRDMHYLFLPVTEEGGATKEVVMHKFQEIGEVPIEERIRKHLKL